MRGKYNIIYPNIFLIAHFRAEAVEELERITEEMDKIKKDLEDCHNKCSSQESLLALQQNCPMCQIKDQKLALKEQNIKVLNS